MQDVMRSSLGMNWLHRRSASPMQAELCFSRKSSAKPFDESVPNTMIIEIQDKRFIGENLERDT